MPKTTSIPTDLIRIIAEAGSHLPRQYDDHIAVALLKYLQAQAAEAKLAIPSLDLYFSGKYPAIDLGQHIVNALHNAHPELQKPDVRRMTEEEYREVCGSIFPPVVLKFYPAPSDYLDPYRNLFPLWILELGKKVAEEVKCCSAAVRLAFGMVRDYIFLCANNWPEGLAHWFFIMWNGYLLNHQWFDRIAELETTLQEERDYSRAAEIMLAQQSKRIVELRKAGEEHYITLTDAAKRALEVEFGRLYEEKDLKALTMRLARQLEGVESIQPRKRRHRYFRVEDVLNALENDPEIKATAEQLRIQILDAGVPRSEIS
jgi:hypothetical protein